MSTDLYLKGIRCGPWSSSRDRSCTSCASRDHASIVSQCFKCDNSRTTEPICRCLMFLLGGPSPLSKMVRNLQIDCVVLELLPSNHILTFYRCNFVKKCGSPILGKCFKPDTSRTTEPICKCLIFLEWGPSLLYKMVRNLQIGWVVPEL